MFRVAIRVLLTLLGLLSAEPCFANVQTGKATPFQIFDGTNYRDKPEVTPTILSRIVIIYESGLWPDGALRDDLPNEQRLREVLRSHRNSADVFVLNMESWLANGIATHRVLELFETVLGWVRQELPGKKIGIYGVIPLTEYWAAQNPRSDKYASWQRASAALAPIVDKVDIIFPSLYTFYEDSEGWERYAKENIALARRLGKHRPVVPFLWPEFHDSSPKRGELIGSAAWRRQIGLMCQLADSVVIWGGFNFHPVRQKSWDSEARWFLDIQQMLREDASCLHKQIGRD